LFVGISLADAIITKAYAPILILGAVGGTLIGWIVQRFGHRAYPSFLVDPSN
jgi:hypothetical protein